MEQGDSVGHSTTHDPTVTTTDLAPLEEWFSRPILTHPMVWNEGTEFPYATFSPWLDYFSQANIRRKLEGYSRMRCDLKVKVLVNGSPFRYGELMLSYRPLYTKIFNPTHNVFPFFSGGQIAGDVITGYPSQDYSAVTADNSTLMARSQRPHIRIQPHINSGGEMTLPFLYYKDAIDITNLTTSSEEFYQALREMGTLTMENVCNLRSTGIANAVGVSISMFVWAENVKLWGPTGINVQAIDEFESTMSISDQASAVAEAAGKLQSVPILRPYALATQFLAGTSASVLKYFGWSNPPVLTAVQAKLPKASYLNPGPCSSFPDDVLALDPKNELTVDPRTVGAQPKDPLLITDFCARSAIVDVLTWQVTDPVETLIAEFPIQPAYWYTELRERTSPKLSSQRITMTPATYASQMFEYWRGTCVIKLKVVSSQFHRGRLLATWDPALITPLAPTRHAARISHVIDLATATEMTIKIPYLHHLGMLRTSHRPISGTVDVSPFRPWTSRADAFNWSARDLRDTCNGVLQLRVLNNLQCGDATADVNIIAEMSFEDMILMCPTVGRRSDGDRMSSKTTLPTTLSRVALTDWTDQSIEVQALEATTSDFVVQGLESPGTSEDMQMIPASAPVDEISKLYGGEFVPSLRSLLHRTYFYKAKSTRTSSSDAGTITSTYVPRFPVPCHTLVDGFMDRVPLAPLATSNNTNSMCTNPISLLTACFAGYRGSMVWKAHCLNNSDSIVMTRSSPRLAIDNLSWTTFADADLYSFDSVVAATCNANNGVAWSSKELAGTVAAVFPQYNNMRMLPGDPITHYLPTTESLHDRDWLDHDGVRVTTFRAQQFNAGLTMKTTITTSVSAGTDYNVFHFLNVPDVYIQVDD